MQLLHQSSHRRCCYLSDSHLLRVTSTRKARQRQFAREVPPNGSHWYSSCHCSACVLSFGLTMGRHLQKLVVCTSAGNVSDGGCLDCCICGCRGISERAIALDTAPSETAHNCSFLRFHFLVSISMQNSLEHPADQHSLNGANFLFVYYIPIYFQSIHSLSASQSGIRNLPLIVINCE
jgi:hypothetical protein